MKKILVFIVIFILIITQTTTAFALEYTYKVNDQEFNALITLNVSDDITQKSNLTEDMFECLLPDSLKGLGYVFYTGEQTYDINALFIMAIINQESSFGTSSLVDDNNNLGGIKGSNGYRNFESKEECILYMFDLLSRKYIENGKDTIDLVSKMYCVPPDHWANSVTNLMNDLINKCNN